MHDTLFFHLYKKIGWECEISFSQDDATPKVAYLLKKAPPNTEELFFRNTLIFTFFEKFLFHTSITHLQLIDEIRQIYHTLWKCVIFNFWIDESHKRIKFYIDFSPEIPYSKRLSLINQALPWLQIGTELSLGDGGLFCFWFDIFINSATYEYKYYWHVDFEKYRHIFRYWMGHKMIVALETSHTRKKFYTKCNHLSRDDCKNMLPHFHDTIERFCGAHDTPHLYAQEILQDTITREEIYFTHIT